MDMFYLQVIYTYNSLNPACLPHPPPPKGGGVIPDSIGLYPVLLNFLTAGYPMVESSQNPDDVGGYHPCL